MVQVAPMHALYAGVCFCVSLWATVCLPQETYQQTHPVLFSDRAVYVIVYSLRAGVNLVDIHRHVMNVTVRCRDAPIVLVGTHSDVIGGDASLPLDDLKAKFPQVCALWGTP
jgi:hypothetical protein